MKFKKFMKMGLVSIMTVAMLTGCSSSGGDNKAKDDKLVIWAFADDLTWHAEKFEEKTGIETEVVVIPPADYPTKINSTLRGKSKDVDIICAEPQMLQNFYEAGYFENLSADPYNANQYEDKFVDYIFEAGKSEDGNLRAMTYQMTPGGVYYRTDIAEAVWGDSSPEFVSEKFSSYENMYTAAKELDENGYKIFPDTGSLNRMGSDEKAQPWVIDGKLNLPDYKLEYMDLAKKIHDEELMAFAPEWSAAWYKAVDGKIPYNAGWEENLENATGNETEVFSYALPSWGLFSVIDKNAEQTKGKWAVAEGPSSFFGGGTFLGINAYSDNKENAWEFIKMITTDEEVLTEWAKETGDVVPLKDLATKLAPDMKVDAVANQNFYDFFLKEAENIDYSVVTKYDTTIGDFFGQAVTAYQEGKKTKDEALAEFYTNVKSAYPELEVPK